MWRSLTLDQTWQATRITFKYCIAYAWMLFCRLSSNCPLIAYFLKKNYSLRKNIFKKFEGLREVTHISLNFCLFGSYWSWDLIGNMQHEGHWRFVGERVTVRCTGLWSPASGQFTGGELLLRRSDRTLKQIFPMSDQMTSLRLVKRRRRSKDRPDSSCVRSVVVGRVWSWLGRSSS